MNGLLVWSSFVVSSRRSLSHSHVLIRSFAVCAVVAVADCTYVLHTASPFVMSTPDEKLLITPAVEVSDTALHSLASSRSPWRDADADADDDV